MGISYFLKCLAGQLRIGNVLCSFHRVFVPHLTNIFWRFLNVFYVHVFVSSEWRVEWRDESCDQWLEEPSFQYAGESE